MWKIMLSAGLFLMMANSVSLAQSVEWSKVAFLMSRCPPGNDDTLRDAQGVVGPEIDLSDNTIAKAALKKGAEFIQEQCPRAVQPASRFQAASGGFYNISVTLHRGDPTTLTKATFGGPDNGIYSKIDAAYPKHRVVRGRNYDANALTWREYANSEAYEKERRAEQRAQAERNAALQTQVAEREKQAADAARSVQQKLQSEIATRSTAFVTANGVKHFVTAAELDANPFVYQGQVVAVYGAFDEMTTATQGIFADGFSAFQVSAIPAGKFTQSNIMVLVAGRVLGKVEVKLPLLGAKQVPHLSFVGSAFCQQQKCADYSIAK